MCSGQYCSQLDQLKVVIYEKLVGFANQKVVMFYQDNAKPHLFVDLAEICTALLGYPTAPNLTLKLWITTYFNP